MKFIVISILFEVDYSIIELTSVMFRRCCLCRMMWNVHGWNFMVCQRNLAMIGYYNYIFNCKNNKNGLLGLSYYFEKQKNNLLLEVYFSSSTLESLV